MAARQIVTLTQFTTLVYNRLGNTAFWTSDEVRQYINAALRMWNAMTGYWHGQTILTAAANTTYYVLPATLVFGAHVEYNSSPLSLGSVFSWDQSDPNWMFRRGTPVEWSPVGINIIALRPIPPVPGGQILVAGVTTTPVLVAGGDFIDIGQEEFLVLLDYIEHLAVFKEGGQEFASTIPAVKAFLVAAGVYNEKLRASAIYRRAMGVDRSQQQKPWRTKPVDDGVGVR